jgi:hypothetical protein
MYPATETRPRSLQRPEGGFHHRQPRSQPVTATSPGGPVRYPLHRAALLLLLSRVAPFAERDMNSIKFLRKKGSPRSVRLTVRLAVIILLAIDAAAVTFLLVRWKSFGSLWGPMPLASEARLPSSSVSRGNFGRPLTSPRRRRVALSQRRKLLGFLIHPDYASGNETTDPYDRFGGVARKQPGRRAADYFRNRPRQRRRLPDRRRTGGSALRHRCS